MRRVECPGFVRFLTFSCIGRRKLLLSSQLRDELSLQIERVHRRRAFDLFAWTIMPEHVHLLLSPNLPAWPVSRILNAIKGPFAKRVLSRWRRSDPPFAATLVDSIGRPSFWLPGGGYDRNIRTEKELGKKVHYIHGNARKRELVGPEEIWPWSSEPWYLGDRSGPVTIDEIW